MKPGAADIRWHRRKDGSEFFLPNGLMNAIRNQQGVLMGFAKIMGFTLPTASGCDHNTRRP